MTNTNNGATHRFLNRLPPEPFWCNKRVIVTRGAGLKDLVARFTHKTWRMWFGDPAMRTVTGQQEKRQHWLEQS